MEETIVLGKIIELHNENVTMKEQLQFERNKNIEDKDKTEEDVVMLTLIGQPSLIE